MVWEGWSREASPYPDCEIHVYVLKLSLNARGKGMTRAGFEYLLRKHAIAASQHCPSLHGKRISPQVLRHTGAPDILQATGDMRKVALWLGHGRAGTGLSGLHAAQVHMVCTVREQ